jgi:hypothetical protein
VLFWRLKRAYMGVFGHPIAPVNVQKMRKVHALISVGNRLSGSETKVIGIASG